MSTKPAMSSANCNALAKLISNAGFQRFIFEDGYKQYGKQMKSLLKKNGAVIPPKCSFGEMINISYNHLLTNYRHEYLYKAALLNCYVLKEYCLSDTILLNEFRVGNSKADVVLVNGTNKVFEIKTELDSPERLKAQINDYFKAFSEVYLVVHNSYVEKYKNLVDYNVGIMAFTDMNTIEVIRPAQQNNIQLDISVMMKALRKEEYLTILRNLNGIIPDVKPIELFKECLNILKQFAVDEVQYEFLKVLKNRINFNTNRIIASPSIPDSLRFSCYQSNLNENEYIALVKRLSYQL